MPLIFDAEQRLYCESVRYVWVGAGILHQCADWRGISSSAGVWRHDASVYLSVRIAGTTHHLHRPFESRSQR